MFGNSSKICVIIVWCCRASYQIFRVVNDDTLLQRSQILQILYEYTLLQRSASEQQAMLLGWKWGTRWPLHWSRPWKCIFHCSYILWEQALKICIDVWSSWCMIGAGPENVWDIIDMDLNTRKLLVFVFMSILPAHQQVGSHRCVQVQVSRSRGREPPRQLQRDWWSL